MKKIQIAFACIAIALSINAKGQNVSSSDYQGIKIYDQNPWYWQYQGKPIILRGGANEDNPFQWEEKELIDQLDLLASVGGNYIRNTMSDRDKDNVYAFKKIGENKYDLNQWNEDYWQRLDFFLVETSKRGIIVQLTLWDQFDIGSSRWQNHPWNPERNINIKADIKNGRKFFYSTVERNDKELLSFQQEYVKKVLSITFQHNNVLYNINNESSESDAWENFWATQIKMEATKAGKKAFVTNMQLSAFNSVRLVMSNDGLYDFVDISQINQDSKGARGPAHWDLLMYLRQKIASYGPIPLNNEKIYGASDGSTNYSSGSETEAIDRFWRNIIGGSASARFHRPSSPDRLWGAGLNERVQTNLKALDMLLEKFDLFASTPHNDLLYPSVSVPSIMEAYVSANIGHQYAIYFPQGRYKIDLDPWVFAEKVKIQWLDINELKWSKPEIVEVEWEGSKNDWGFRGSIKLQTPDKNQCIAFLEIMK